MNGFNSKIFERNSVPGGVAACWKRGDYLIDGGIHFNMGYKPGVDLYEIYKEVGIHKTKHVDMEVYGEFIDEAKGKSIKIHKDLDRLQNELIQLFPKDVKTIKQIIKGSSKLAKIDISLMGLEKPSELMTLWDQIRMMGASAKIVKYMFSKM